MNPRLYKFWLLLLSLVVLSGIGMAGVFAAPDKPGGLAYSVYLPSVARNTYAGSAILGRVVDPAGQPLAGVTVRTDSGKTAITDSHGDYAINGLVDDVYTVVASGGGRTYAPSFADVVVPPQVTNLTFQSITACSEAIVNGSFEDGSGWEIPVTDYPAGYSSAQAHSGSRSMRTGIVIPGDNRYSYSSARQIIDIPSGTTSATLGFWVKPFSGEVMGESMPTQPEASGAPDASPLAGDVQYVLILDRYGNWIDTLLWQRSNAGQWLYYSFNLTAYAGQRIQVHFGTYNDGYNGISSMYVDDVSLQLCSNGSPTPTPPPGSCTNLVDNPGFEFLGDWEIPVTRYPANYATAQAHSGTQSMRTGIIYAPYNTYSYSDFHQAVSIPAGATTAMARFWLYTLSGEVMGEAAGEPLAMPTPTGRPFQETALAGDVQYVLILDRYQNWIDTLVWQRADEAAWHYYEFDLRRYAGQTIYLHFGTYNDGFNGVSAMYVDDVSLDNCLVTPTPGPSPTPTNTPTVTPTPTATATPGPCTELVVNNNFEGSNGWEIILTRYPAGYSYGQYHSPSRSMRTGIVLPGDNTYSYSDFRQVVSIPSNARIARLGMWLYPLSGEAPMDGTLPPPPQTQFFGLTPLAYDAQYLLILDQNDNWIDTLVWMRSNSQVWHYQEFSLAGYAGRTIKLQWGTYNDGYGGITAMYVDDVTLQACP